MKNVLFTILVLSLNFGASFNVLAQETGAPSQGDPEHSGVAGGGAGGLPSGKAGTTSFGSGYYPTISLVTTPYSPTQPSFRRPGISSAVKPSEVLLTRRQMLDAIDTALNANDLSIKVDEELATVRILSIDLKRATLRGRILESNKPVLLIEKAKQAATRALPSAE